MGKKAYIGVNNVSRKIKKAYVGVGGVARKVKKSYIGVGGVARPTFTGGELTYYGTITPLTAAVGAPVGCSNGSYAIICPSNGESKIADAYNANLVKSTVSLSSVNNVYAGSSIGSTYAVTNSSMYVDVIDQNLVVTKLTTPRQVNSSRMAKVGNYCLISGGNSSTSASTTVNALNSSLVFSTAPVMQNRRYMPLAGETKDYAIFGGGVYDSDGIIYYKTVDAYNTSLVKTICPELTEINGTTSPANAVSANGEYAIFAVSRNSTTICKDAYSNTLSKTTIQTQPSPYIYYQEVFNLGDYTVYCAGRDPNGVSPYPGVSTVFSYDTSLVLQTQQSLSNIVYKTACASIGEFGLVAGGSENYFSPVRPQSIVSAYTVG